MKNGTRKKSEKHNIYLLSTMKHGNLSHKQRKINTRFLVAKYVKKSILKLLILSLYDYRHRAARAALESPPHSLYDYRHRAARARLPPSLLVQLHAQSSPCCTRVPPSLPVRLQAQSSPCCTRVPPSLPVRLQVQSSPCCTRLPPSLPVNILSHDWGVQLQD